MGLRLRSMAVSFLLLSRLLEPHKALSLSGVWLHDNLSLGWPAWGLIIAAELLLAPAAQELVFRALLLPRLASCLPLWGTLTISGLVATRIDSALLADLSHRASDVLYLVTRSWWPSLILSICCSGVRLAAVVL